MSDALAVASPTLEPSPARRRLILAICCMSLLIVGLDNTIVNVALPSIGRDLHTTVKGLQWTVDAYTLVIASLLMLSGSMGDRLGRRRVFAAGLVLFSLGSLLCSAAPGLGWLITFRMLQGVGGSMLNPVAMSIIRNVFTDPRERAWAIGMWGATVGVSLALGPVVGGALVSSAGWRSIFWINVPVGLAALALTLRFVPESRAPRPRRFDPVGQGLVIVLLSSLTYAIIEAPTAGWVSTQSVALFVLAAAALAGLVAYERRREEPLLELRFFSSVPFSGASAIAVCAFAALGGFLFLNTLYLQAVRHLSPFTAGLYTLPIAAMTLVFAPLSGRLVGRHGPRAGLLVGGLGIGLGGALLSGLSASTPLPSLLPAYFAFGIGFGMVNPPITTTAVVGMPPAQAGVAAAVASTSRQVGQTLGVAVVGAIAATGLGTVGAGFVQASHTGWWIVAGCGAAVFVLGMLSTTARANATARKIAAEQADAAPAASPDAELVGA
ncbi:MAG TPA: MFS transporter [Solirubrobacteraceae bacterium]|jgi:EmrB/QacA subfamily drug resistance transporter|nr:MFS transporter [Solirubrobacteraceae bacterium]